MSCRSIRFTVAGLSRQIVVPFYFPWQVAKNSFFLTTLLWHVSPHRVSATRTIARNTRSGSASPLSAAAYVILIEWFFKDVCAKFPDDATKFFYLGWARLFLLSCKKWLEVNESYGLTVLFLTNCYYQFRREINCSPIAVIFTVQSANLRRREKVPKPCHFGAGIWACLSAKVLKSTSCVGCTSAEPSE